jgi:hypothetical protein
MKLSVLFLIAVLLAGICTVRSARAQTTTQSYTTITTAPAVPSVTTTRSVTTTTQSTAAPSQPLTIQESIPDTDQPNAQVLGTAVTGNTTILFEAANGEDIHSNRLRTWDDFAQAHPRIANALAYNPSLMDDSAYLSRHPALNEFFAAHPDVKNAMEQDPGNFAAIPPRPGE